MVHLPEPADHIRLQRCGCGCGHVHLLVMDAAGRCAAFAPLPPEGAKSLAQDLLDFVAGRKDLPATREATAAGSC